MFDNLLGRRKRSEILTADDEQVLEGAASADEVVASAVDWLSRVLQPEAAYGYLWNREDSQYRLSATATQAGHTEPEPDYSGLMAGSPVEVQAPLVLSPADVPPRTELIDKAGERWLILPCGSACLVRVKLGRFQRVSRSLFNIIGEYARLAGPLASMAQRLADARAEAERLQASLQASRVAAESVLRPDRSLEVLFRLPLGILGAQHGALVVVEAEAGTASLAAVHGNGTALSTRILAGAAPELLELPGTPDLVTGEPLGQLRSDGIAAIVRVPIIQDEEVHGCGFYFFTHEPDLSPYQIAVMTTLGERFGQVISSAQFMAETADQYLNTLRSLVTAMDAMAPHSVGHSDRLARYARMIARELGLSAEEIESIALGAYLHDVGMVALDLQLINSAGRLTPDQFEQVKQHASLGSELVAIVQSALPVSTMVAHHHERFDGHGYPHRLKGQEIPLGGRIIAVCDLFEAKTTSRGARKGLPFPKALEAVQAAAGSQLDPEVVAAFVRAWKNLRKAAALGRPPAFCHVLRQIPSSICGTCPNRGHTEPQSCWENSLNLCTRHGDDCNNCVVFSEAMARSQGV